MNRSAFLRTVALTIPVAILIYYSNAVVWLISGYPLGFTPAISELSSTAFLLWKFVTFFRYIVFFFFGVLYVWFCKSKSANLSTKDAAIGGAITGVATSIVTNLLRVLNIINVELPSVQRNTANYPASGQPYFWVTYILGVVVGIIAIALFSTLLSATGALIAAKILKRK
jgi:hypothetical protein